MIQWDDLRVLLALQRGRSFAAAGKTLGVDATTVARRLRALEEAVGARLLERTPEGLVFTAAGTRALGTAERLGEAVAELERGVMGADARVEGPVRLTAGDGLLVHALAPALPALYARHPGLRLELLAATRTLDLARREADVAVRLRRPREPSLVTRRLAVLPYGLYASPGYLARRGTPRRASDLAEHDIIAFDQSLASTPEMRWLARHVPGSRIVLRASSLPVLLAACAAGVGILAMAELFAGAGEFVRVLPRAELPGREAWAVVHPDLHGAARVTVVLGWLAETLRAEAGSAA